MVLKLGSFGQQIRNTWKSFEMWCWRRMEKLNWTDHVRNEEVLLKVKEQRNIIHEISKQKTNWIGHILCRNCLLQRVIERKIKGGIEVTGRRRRKLLDDLNPFPSLTLQSARNLKDPSPSKRSKAFLV